MVIDFTEEELKVIREGLMELPIKVALNTLVSLDDKILNAHKQQVTMATPVVEKE